MPLVKKMKKAERTNVVRKICPECETQCPVALRSCNCGYSFKARPPRGAGKVKQNTGAKGGKAGSSASIPVETDMNLDKVGRRFRTKRMRPDYFNSLELEYASKTFRTRKPKQEDNIKKKKKRGRPKGSTGIPRKPKEDKKKEDEVSKAMPELDDLYANFPQEKLQQFSFILDELNFKMSSQIFKPL